MMTRRLLLPFLAPLLLLPAPALAQRLGPFNQIGGPSPVSTQVSNSSTTTTIASYDIPIGYLSAGRAHLKLLGDLSTLNSSPGTITVTVIACGTSTTVVNGVTVDTSLSSAPWSYDLWLSPYGLSPSTAQTIYLYSDWRDAKTSSSETMLKKVARVTCDTTQAASLTVQFAFGTADAGNGLRVESAVFSMGQ